MDTYFLKDNYFTCLFTKNLIKGYYTPGSAWRPKD